MNLPDPGLTVQYHWRAPTVSCLTSRNLCHSGIPISLKQSLDLPAAIREVGRSRKTRGRRDLSLLARTSTEPGLICDTTHSRISRIRPILLCIPREHMVGLGATGAQRDRQDPMSPGCHSAWPRVLSLESAARRAERSRWLSGNTLSEVERIVVCRDFEKLAVHSISWLTGDPGLMLQTTRPNNI